MTNPEYTSQNYKLYEKIIQINDTIKIIQNKNNNLVINSDDKNYIFKFQISFNFDCGKYHTYIYI